MSNQSTNNAILLKQISQADSQGAFFSREQLDALSSLVRDGGNRIEILKRITSCISSIVTNAARALFEEQPHLIAPGGNAYPNRRMAACLRDMEIILRYITYAFLAGDTIVLDDRLLNSLSETYQALGVPTASVAVSIQKMKVATIGIAKDPNNNIQGDCSHLISELAEYFDYVALTVEGINLITTQEIERKNTVENQVDISFDYIDQKSISAWISEETDEEEFQLTVNTTYTLNLKVVESEGGNMPGSSLSESLSEQGLDTEWVVSSSTVELRDMTNDTLITSTPIGLKTIWAANFSLHIPIFGDSKISQLQIIPRSLGDVSLSVLIYAYGSLYRQFDIQLDVVFNQSEILSIIAC